MSDRHITRFEHQSIPVGGRAGDQCLSVAEADILMRAGAARPGLCSRGYASVTLGSWCGVVGLGGRVLEILPKLDEHVAEGANRALLVNMLRRAGALPGVRIDTAAQQSVRQPLLEVFISAFFDALFRIAKGGLMRRYETHLDDLRVVRGKIVARRQLGVLADRRDIIACEFDELTADNPWNRVLKAALRVTRPWIGDARLAWQWVELMGVLDEVADTSDSVRDLDRLAIDRHAMRYAPALTWAGWILRTLSPALRAGSSEAPALVFDMNRVFQEAVALEAARQLPGGVSLTTQDHSIFLGRAATPMGPVGTHRLIPDLVFRQTRGSVVAVADTKWKVIRGSGGIPEVGSGDAYQMLAYAVAYRVERLVILAPGEGHWGEDVLAPIELPMLNGLRPRLQVCWVYIREPHWRLPDLVADPASVTLTTT